jgi:urease accessory protein
MDMPSSTTTAGWKARLALTYSLQQGRTVAHHVHEGPLRVLQSLYPEGNAICHQVLVHPPGGLAGGDELDIRVQVQTGAHALVTTPGATRFYRSEAGQAAQRVQVCMQEHARLEWLPLETIAYNGCLAENRVSFDMAPTASLMAWDVLALGLPASNQPFVQGHFLQHLEVQGAWLDRGLIDATDRRLLDGPVGLAGYRCLATLVMASGSPLNLQQLELALEQARSITRADGRFHLGMTSPHPRVLVARVVCDQTEPARLALQSIWAAWRPVFWGLQPQPSRMWQV